MSQPFTCVTCHVAFNESEIQRAHYKTDWHRYNLKRKVVDLPPVTAQTFVERVQLQKSQIENAKKESVEELFCKICGKHFTSRNSFHNHIQSNKHKELEAKEKTADSSGEVIKVEEKSNKTLIESNKKVEAKIPKEETIELIQTKIDDNEEDEDGNEWEDIEENEDDLAKKFDESQGIDLNTCLFCEHKSQSIESKIEHMAKEHSFFIPNSDYLTDVEGLLKYLGVKIGVYHVCIWCSSRCFPTLKAVQQHMSDKGHFKMKFEGDTLLEYADFYGVDDEDDEVESVSDESDIEEVANFLEDETYELVLPSGVRIGHRSLFRYFKQSFGHKSLELKARCNYTIRDKYRALGYNTDLTTTKSELHQKRKDLAKFQHWKSKMQTRMSVNANKMQTHFRRQNITF